MEEVFKVYPQLKCNVYDDDINKLMCGRKNNEVW